MTTVPHTIADVALAGLSDEFVIQAVRSGLTASARLLAEAALRSQHLVQVLRRALAEVAQP